MSKDKTPVEKLLYTSLKEMNMANKKEEERQVLLDFCSNIGESDYELLSTGLSETVINNYLKEKEEYYKQLSRDNLEILRGYY